MGRVANTRLSQRNVVRLIAPRERVSYPTNHDRQKSFSYRHLTTVTATSDLPPPPPPPPQFSGNASPTATTTSLGDFPIQRTSPVQPPSHKPPDQRNSQLHRQYTSLLQSTPLILLFQHNNLKASEWAGIRRELESALRRSAARKPDEQELLDAGVKPRIQIVQKNVFAAALRVLEYWKPKPGEIATHLSEKAYRRTLWRSNSRVPLKKRTSLEPLLSGPIAMLSFPELSPGQLASALSILSPVPRVFPAPRRRDAPSLYEPATQAGLEKLVLLGARVNGRVMDIDGIKWVGGLAARGGLEGLRAEVVALLQGVGMQVTRALEGAGSSLWATVESRRLDLEGVEKDKDTKEDTPSE